MFTHIHVSSLLEYPAEGRDTFYPYYFLEVVYLEISIGLICATQLVGWFAVSERVQSEIISPN